MFKLVNGSDFYGKSEVGNFVQEFYECLSTDAKRTEGIAVGSVLRETNADSGENTYYRFNETLAWEQIADSGSGGADPEIIDGDGKKLSDLSEVALGWKDEDDVVHKIPDEYIDRDVFVVTFTGNGGEIEADCTIDDIREALENGKMAIGYFENGDSYYYLMNDSSFVNMIDAFNNTDVVVDIFTYIDDDESWLRNTITLSGAGGS